MISDGGKGVHI